MGHPINGSLPGGPSKMLTAHDASGWARQPEPDFVWYRLQTGLQCAEFGYYYVTAALASHTATLKEV